MQVKTPTPLSVKEDTSKNTVNNNAQLNNTSLDDRSKAHYKAHGDVQPTLDLDKLIDMMNPRNNDSCSAPFQSYIPENLKDRVEVLAKRIETSNSKFGYIAILYLVNVLEKKLGIE